MSSKKVLVPVCPLYDMQLHALSRLKGILQSSRNVEKVMMMVRTVSQIEYIESKRIENTWNWGSASMHERMKTSLPNWMLR
jgi:hypothetical protein